MARAPDTPQLTATALPRAGLHHRTVRTVTAPSAEDLDIARADALLQLRIGRSSHYYAILVSAALFLDAIAVLAFPPSLASGSFGLGDLYYLFPPIFAGVFLSIFALFLKWDEFQLWPWERHFWTTVLAVVANVVAALLLVAGVAGVGPTANWPLTPGLLPLALGGISATMAGFALTWPTRSHRQMAALISSVIPFPLGFVLLVPGLPFARTVGLALALLGSSYFVLMAGSWLHLISSGTRAHEREMINSGQTKIFALADELGKRERSLQLREASVLEKETNLDDQELSLKRRLEAAEEQRGHLDAMETELRGRSEALAAEQRKWATQSAEAVQATRSAADRQTDLELRERQLEARLPLVKGREDRVAELQAEVTRREAEAMQARDEAARREAGFREAEARLEVRRADVERRTAEIEEREARFRAIEVGAVAADQDRSVAAQRLADLEGREARLHTRELSLNELQSGLAQQSSSQTAAARALAEREAKVAQSTQSLATREAALARREHDVADSAAGNEAARLRYEEAVRGLSTKLSELDTRARELDRRTAQVQAREQSATEAARATERESRLAGERAQALDRRERELRAQLQVLTARPPEGSPGTTDPRGALGPALPAEASSPRRRLPGRQSIGVPRLDDLLLGGLPSKSHVLLLGPPFIGKETLLFQFVGEGLRRGETVVLISAGRPVRETSDALRSVVPDLADRERAGRVVWIDAAAPSPARDGPGRDPARPLSSAELLAALVQAARTVEGQGHGSFRVGVIGLTHLFHGLSETEGAAFFQNLVGILKPREALAAYTVDAGVLPETLLNVVTARTDGVVEFREDRGRTQLSVRGLGDVETREWIDYRAGATGLVIGSFALERIR